MNNNPEPEEEIGDKSASHSLQRIWPPPIVEESEDPVNMKPARSFVEKVRAESKILGRFAVVGMPYSFLVTFFNIGATAFLSPSGPSIGYLAIASIAASCR